MDTFRHQLLVLKQIFRGLSCEDQRCAVHLVHDFVTDCRSCVKERIANEAMRAVAAMAESMIQESYGLSSHPDTFHQEPSNNSNLWPSGSSDFSQLLPSSSSQFCFESGSDHLTNEIFSALQATEEIDRSTLSDNIQSNHLFLASSSTIADPRPNCPSALPESFLDSSSPPRAVLPPNSERDLTADDCADISDCLSEHSAILKRSTTFQEQEKVVESTGRYEYSDSRQSSCVNDNSNDSSARILVLKGADENAALTENCENTSVGLNDSETASLKDSCSNRLLSSNLLDESSKSSAVEKLEKSAANSEATFHSNNASSANFKSAAGAVPETSSGLVSENLLTGIKVYRDAPRLQTTLDTVTAVCIEKSSAPVSETTTRTVLETTSDSLEHKVFRCPQCDYTAKHRQNLHRHVRNVHRNLPSESNKYRCEVCQDRSFKTSSALKEHIIYKHSNGVRNYLCKGCANSFVTKKDLNRHLRKFCKLSV